jgi:hypothetical protein
LPTQRVVRAATSCVRSKSCPIKTSLKEKKERVYV